MSKTDSPHKTDNEYNNVYKFMALKASKILSVF
jgi:hypothetical protein